MDKSSYFLPNTPLTDAQQRYCRCLLHVGGKNPNKRYNPYAVCTASVGQQYRGCSQYYAFENIPDDELIGWAIWKNMQIPNPYDRQELLALINTKMKREKGFDDLPKPIPLPMSDLKRYIGLLENQLGTNQIDGQSSLINQNLSSLSQNMQDLNRLIQQTLLLLKQE